MSQLPALSTYTLGETLHTSLDLQIAGATQPRCFCVPSVLIQWTNENQESLVSVDGAGAWLSKKVWKEEGEKHMAGNMTEAQC